MRFLSARSVRDGRKAMLAVVIVMMPLAAVAVSNAGWVGKALVESGQLDAADCGYEDQLDEQGELVMSAEDQLTKNIFVQVSDLVCPPGVFGLVVAAVVAALMSTLDTLITAVSAVAVNDVWRTLRPNRPDSEYLRVAKYMAIASAAVGVALLPLFQNFTSIYQALSAFTSTVAPPLVVVIVLGITWERLTSRAAFWSVLIGFSALVVSQFYPSLIKPIAHGIPPEEGYSYIRALFGLLATAVPAVVISYLDPAGYKSPEPGLMLSSIGAAMRKFKGGEPNYQKIGQSKVVPVKVVSGDQLEVRLPTEVAEHLAIQEGDHLHISDDRWWLGGFRSLSIPCGPVLADGDSAVLTQAAVDHGNLRTDRPVRVEKIL